MKSEYEACTVMVHDPEQETGYQLPINLIHLEPYQPLLGEYKIRLDANESFFSLPLSEALAGADLALNRYPDPYASRAVEAFGKRYGVSPELVTAGNGSDELISIIAACFLDKHDSVMSFVHDFSMYQFYPEVYGKNREMFHKKPDLTLPIDEAIAHINRAGVRCLFLSNPCNPTSLGEKACDLIRFAAETKALVVIDEAYMEFWDENESLLGRVEEFDNLIVLKTCSKALGMAGIRLGFAVANKRLTKALRAAKSPYNVSTITQHIGAYILERGFDVEVGEIKRLTAELYSGLCALELDFVKEIYRPCTNFVFLKSKKSHDIYQYLLEKSIAVRCFGEYLRISCGSEKENRELLRTLNFFKEK